MKIRFFLPSNRINDEAKVLLQANMNFIREQGAESEMPTFEQIGYLSWTPRQKVNRFAAILSDLPDVVFFTKGGFSAHAMIPLLENEIGADVLKRPVYFWFSDHTSLLMHLHSKGAKCFYGVDGLYGIREKWSEISIVQNDGKANASGEFLSSLAILKPWNFAWKLVGGFLESFLLYAIAYHFPLEKRVLFLESTCSTVDFEGYLLYMKSLWLLENLGGVILGNVFPEKDWRWLAEIVSDVFKEYDYAVYVSDRLGHWKENLLIGYGDEVQ